MIVRDLIANHGHDIGHRRLVRDEVWCRMQFRSDADLIAFAKSLRWSAFRFVEPAPASEDKPGAVAAAVKPEPAAKHTTKR
jgi:hypothetical protein